MSERMNRRARQRLGRVGAGVHPLADVVGFGLPLHPDAERSVEAGAAGPRCGTCMYRRTVYEYPKCLFPGSRRVAYPRVGYSSASDVDAAWPACRDYSASASRQAQAA